jgi:tetratricopeptide (TPR) repeat protein
MRHISTKEKNETIMNANIFRQKRSFMPLFLMTALLLSMMAPSLSFGAEKKAKPQAQAKPQAVPAQKDIVLNDANLQTYQKRVEDLVKKGDFDNSLKIMLKINNYTKEVLSTVRAIKTQYEKAVNDPSVSQNDKEDLFIKLKGLNQLIPRYTTLYDASTFNLGYIYAKLGETEKARKYLVEFLQITPYSSGRDSQWIKAKTLLLELYSLEGEF